MFVTLGLGIALPLVILHGNHANASNQVGGVKLTADSKSGRMLFGQHCAVCHTLAAANAIGKVGPNLDLLKPPAAEVLHVIENGCLPNVTVADENEACLGQGVMPAQVVTGRDARDVASFVAPSRRALTSAVAHSRWDPRARFGRSGVRLSAVPSWVARGSVRGRTYGSICDGSRRPARCGHPASIPDPHLGACSG